MDTDMDTDIVVIIETKNFNDYSLSTYEKISFGG